MYPHSTNHQVHTEHRHRYCDLDPSYSYRLAFEGLNNSQVWSYICVSDWIRVNDTLFTIMRGLIS